MPLSDNLARANLIVGLASRQLGEDLHDSVRHTTGTSNALTVGSTTLRLGVTGGTVAFFGGTGSTRASSTGVTDVTGLITVLRNYGLFS